MNKIDKKSVLRLVLSFLVIVGILALFYLISYILGWTKLSKDQLREFIASTGVFAPLVFIAVSFLQVTFVPVPSAVTIVAGSYLFGIWLSFLYSYIGIVLGSLFAFFLGKKCGRPFVNWAFGSKEQADEYMARLKGKEKVVLFFMFLLPTFPDDALCALAGILPITWFQFICMQLVTRVTSILGTLFFMSGEIIPYTGWGLAVIITVAILSIVAFIICFKHAEKINKGFDNFTEKISNKLKK
jgi:uncharacterized membrane protein YdjX (TVP38/TMEM64 family)